MKEIGVVIPAYCAGRTVGGVIDDLLKQGFKKENTIVVNDGSGDDTEEVVKSKGVSFINHNRNMGKGAALKSGFNLARERSIKKAFTIDADAQHQVSEVNTFLPLNGKYDILIGQRTGFLSSMPLDRKLSNLMVNLVVSLLSGVRTTDVQCGFRYIDLRIFDKMVLTTNNYQTESEMVIRAARRGYTVGFVPITTVYRDQKSYINRFTDTLRFINMAVRFLWR